MWHVISLIFSRRLLTCSALAFFGLLLLRGSSHPDLHSILRAKQSSPPPLMLSSQRRCEILPAFRPTFPPSAPADDTALPSTRVGSASIFDSDADSGCVPALTRLGPFADNKRPWPSLRWGGLQHACAEARFKSLSDLPHRKLNRISSNTDEDFNPRDTAVLKTGLTAVVFRVWDGYEYSQNQLAWLRAVISELSLDTGGSFQVFLLVNVKDNSVDLFDDNTYQLNLKQSVPPEFQDMALLYNEQLLREWYPKVFEHSAQDQMYQALQIFSYSFPEFDYVWQMEMDIRFTGNVARLFTQASTWASKQPRKNLWERNAQWFIPALHGSFESFSEQVDQDIGDAGIWGPHQQAHLFVEPQRPRVPDRSQTNWGINEEAELINFAPIVDTVNTNWTYEHTIHGFEPADKLPRRMAMISVTRTSRRLLRLISADQRARGRWLVSESTPETWSLLHGLKAVFIPHLISFDTNYQEQGKLEMAPEKLDAMLHKGPAWSRAGGMHGSFLYSLDVGLPELRWLNASYFYWASDAERLWKEYTDGRCTHSLLLHPIKND